MLHNNALQLSLEFRHPQLGLIRFELDQKSKRNIVDGFNNWQATGESGGLSRFLNKITIDMTEPNKFASLLSCQDMFPEVDSHDEELATFLATKHQNKQPCCHLVHSQNQLQITLHAWVSQFIKNLFAIDSSSEKALLATQNYLTNIYIIALEIIIDEKNQFQPWIHDLIGSDNIKKVSEKHRPALILHFVSALAMWLTIDLNTIYGKDDDIINYSRYIGSVIFNLISSINNDKPQEDGKTVLSQFIETSLLVRPTKVMPRMADKKQVSDKAKLIVQPTKGKYPPSHVDLLNLAYFKAVFNKPTQVVCNKSSSAESHHHLLNKVVFWKFANPADGGASSIVLFRTVKDFSQNDAKLAASPSSSVITSLNTALQDYKEAKMTACQKLIIPIAVTADRHFRLLVIELGKKPKITFYDSRPSFVAPVKAMYYSIGGAIQTAAVSVGLRSPTQPSVPTLFESLEYIRKCSTDTFGDNFIEENTGQQSNDIDCGVYTVHYALAIAYGYPIRVNIETARQLDAVILQSINTEAEITHQSVSTPVVDAQHGPHTPPQKNDTPPAACVKAVVVTDVKQEINHSINSVMMKPHNSLASEPSPIIPAVVVVAGAVATGMDNKLDLNHSIKPIDREPHNSSAAPSSAAAINSGALSDEKPVNVATINNVAVSEEKTALNNAMRFNPKRSLDRIPVNLNSPDHPMYTQPAAIEKPSGTVSSVNSKSHNPALLKDFKAGPARLSISVDNKKNNIRQQAAAFRKIYTALRDGQSGLFKSNFLKNKNTVSDNDLIKQISERSRQQPDSRTNKAWELAQLHYLNCSTNNTVLFTAIYKWAFEKSGNVFKKSNLTHTRFFSSNSFNKQVNTLSKDQIDNGIAENNDSRTARIARSLQ